MPQVRRRSTAVARIALAAVLAGGEVACAARPAGPMTVAELEAVVASRGLDPAEIVLPFALDERTADWLADALASTAGHPTDAERLDRILALLLAPPDDPSSAGMLEPIRYERQATATASEVFATRRANCLGFAFLVAGLARAAGVRVEFLMVPEVESFTRDGDLVVTSEHVTVGHGPADRRRLLTFALGPRVDYASARPISDLTAIALYYSNVGAEALRRGELPRAADELEIAVALDPGLAQGWSNLGVARRRLGDLEGAERAYLTALERDPGRTSALQNLAALLELRGDEPRAVETLALAERSRGGNPFTLVELGDLAASLGRGEEAGRFYRKALDQGAAEAEVQAALGLWELDRGHPRAARRRLARAERLDPLHPRVRRLADRLRPGALEEGTAAAGPPGASVP